MGLMVAYRSRIVRPRFLITVSSDNAGGERWPFSAEVRDRTAAVHEVWGEEILEDGDFRSRRADFRFHSCLEQLPEGRGA